MAIGQAKASRGPTSLTEEARLSGEFADWNNLILDVAWLTGELNIGALRDAWWRVCLRHDAMRRAYVSPDEACTHAEPLSEVEFHTAETDAEALELMRRILGVPFDLYDHGLSRIVIVRRDDRRHLVGIVLDHIITDEISWTQLLLGMAAFYRRALERDVSDITEASTYHSFASLQRREFDGPWGKTRREFWQSHTAEFGPYPPPFSARGEIGGTPSFKALDLELSADVVSEFARRARATPFVVIASGVLAAMQEVTGDSPVGLVTEDHGRMVPGTSRTVGLFVQTVPLRLTRRTKDPVETVREVFLRSLDVFEYSLPFRVSGNRWQENLVSPGGKPGVHLQVHDRTFPRVGWLAGTVTENVRLEVPGGHPDTSQTIQFEGHLIGTRPRLVATYNENLYSGAVIEQMLRLAVEFMSSGVN
ncbi:hypothetical protein JYK22_02120, partial [Nonomuraea sp. RK-328]|nr:hypothetical protein [Nonomuraea sp. RK-328]